MKTKKIAAIAAASGLMLMGSAWAHGWNSGQASSGSGYATPGTTVFTGNTVAPIDHAPTMNAQPVVEEQSTTVYTTPGSTSSVGSSGTSSSDDNSSSAGTSGTQSPTVTGYSSDRIVGYTQTDQAPLDRAEVHRQASEFARLRANASGEQPDYPARQQMFLGTAPGQSQQ